MDNEKKIETVFCNFCGSKKYKTHVILKNKTNVDFDFWKIVKCIDCGLIYTNPRLTIKEISKLYSSEYNTFRKPGLLVKIIHLLKKWRVRFAREIDGKKGDLILDVGCGDGYFLMSCKDKGFRVLGLDLDANLSKKLKEKYNIDVLVGEFSSAKIKEGSVDCVTMHHMIEHSYDPMLDLKKAYSVLKIGGILQIEVPNVEGLEFSIFKKAFHYTLPFHTFHFSKKSLTNFLKKTGFEIIEIKYPFFSPYIYSNSIILTLFPNINSKLEILLMILMFPLVLPFSLISSLQKKGSIIFIKAKKI